MHLQPIECVFIGKVVEASTGTGIANAQVILDLGGGNIADLRMFVYTKESGEFEIKQAIQSGITFEGKLTGKSPTHYDSYLLLTVSADPARKHECRYANNLITLKTA